MKQTNAIQNALIRGAVPALAASACIFLSFGCGDLAGILGNAEPVACNITGQVVGVDGEQPAKVDIQWVPDADLSQSFEVIKATVDADGSFIVTELVSERDNTRVQGELRFGEEPIPPIPLKYDQIAIDIDLPATSCTQDLGVVTLPFLGMGGTSNGTGGTSNGTTGTSNGTTGTSNGTTGG